MHMQSRKHSATLLKMRRQEVLEVELLGRRIEDMEQIAYAPPFKSFSGQACFCISVSV